MIFKIAMVLAFGFTTGASAQSTTKCSEFMGDVTCKTDQAAPPVSWRDVPPKRCSKVDLFVYSANQCDAREVASARKAVGDMIAAGKCDDALKAALGTGDLQFAAEVRSFCAGGK